MIRRTCAISRLFSSTFSPPLSLWHLRLFFAILLCISFTATALSAARLLTARFLSQQPFLHLGALICSAVGLIRCRGNHLQNVFCTSHTSKRLRQATLCASVAITLSTLASLPTPISATATASSSDVAHLDLWLLLALTLCVQVFLPGGRARHLVCTIIALAHAVIVIVTRFTSSNAAILNGIGGIGGSECFLCWNSFDMRFWRKVASNLVAFTLTNLIGWHLSCQNYLERWRCLCVVLHAAARQSTLCSTQKKLNRISRAIVPPALTTDLEHDFYSPPYVWSSPLVIYLRNVSFLSAELVGFYTSNGTGSCCAGGGFSPIIPNNAIPEVERYPQPSSQHVVAFTNHFIGQIKALCENHGCYAVHVRPGEVLCIAGYPEVRVDHANSCVQLALGINRLLRSLSNAARIKLEARMAIHTGEAYAALLGQSALTFDLLGADVFHLRRHLRTAAKPGRVLVSRATFDQLPEGYEGELGPTVVDPSTNRHVVHCETLYVQPRKSTDTSVSSAECLDSRWPNLGESISTGGLAQAFARLAHQVTLESAESSVSAETSTLISILRQMRMKEEGMEGEDEVTACLKGLCDHRCLPTPSALAANSSIKALEFRLLPSPSSSFLIALCHNLPSSVGSYLHPLLPSPPLSTQNSSSTSSSLRCKHGSCEDLKSASMQCNSCPAQFLGPSIDALCPLAEAVLWNRLFLQRHQLKVLRNSLAWMVLLLLLLGLTGGLLVTRVSFALIVYPCVITWCLLLLAAFSIRRLDNLTCFPVTLRQACVVFTLFLLLASLLFMLMFVSFEVHQPISEFAVPWQRTPQLSTTTIVACLSLLLLLTLTPSVPPTPLNSAIVAAIFSGLHITFATTRFIHLPTSISNSSSTFFWTTLLPNSLAAHLVFVLLVCLLPWQTAKLRHWTEQWVKNLLEQKVDLTGRRFALEHLLDNQIPRAHLPTEPSNTLAESCTYPSSLSDLFPPREHLATGVIAITIYGIGKGDDMLQYQRSPIRSVALSQSITTTATASSSTASRRSREATVIADAVRRLNRRICLIDQMACGDDTETLGNAVNRIVKLLSKPSLPLVKVHSVGNCVAYALLDADSSPQLGLFAAFLIHLFEELERLCLQKSGEDFRSGDEALACRLQIGLHIGATVSGVVDGPQFLLLHETLDFALRLANATPPVPMDRSLLLASTDFVARRGTESLVGAQPIGVNGGGGNANTGDVFLWTADIQHVSRLIAVMRPVLSTVIQPPVFRNRSKKPLATPPNLEHLRSASSLVNSNSSPPPPPPPPPHKRNYAVGEARYQNHSSPLLPRRDRKLSSPLLPPRHSSPPSRWALKSVSLGGPGDGDNVDRACFAMAEVEIVNGYAQPTTRLMGNGVTASPYCITKDTNGYANHQSHQPVLEPPKSAIDVAAASITSSDNVFLAVEGACERVEALQNEAVTSLSSASPTTTANTHHHHSNPLYTDNEYYDDEEVEEVDENIIDGVKQSGDEMSDGCIDAGVEWLQRAPMLGDFSVSVISGGSNFPNYRRPSTPPSNPRQTLYNPPIVAGAAAVANGNSESQRRTSVKLNDKDSTSIDLLSTCAVPSVACDYEFEAGIIDFSVNDDEEEDDLDAEMANNSTHAESGDVPLLMDTSWMTSTEGGGGVDGVPSKTPKMSDSLLVETGGPLEDDFSEFSSSAAVAAATTGGDEEGSSSAHLLAAYTSDPDADGDNNDDEGDDSVFLPPTYFPLIDQSGNHHRRGHRLPDIAPVRLPNFAAAANHHPTSVLPANNQIVKPLSPPLLVDLTCPPSPPPPNNAPTRAISGGQDMAEYDNLENAYSSAAPTNCTSLHPTTQHSGWRPRDVRGHRRGGLLPRRIDNPYQRHLRLNAHIVDEARRICQRLHAMGWQSALSLQTKSSPSASSPEDPSGPNRHNEAPPGKAILLLPPPPPLPPPSAHPFVRTPKRGDYVNSHSLLRRLQVFDSGTVTTVTSQIDDDQMTDDGTFDSEFIDDGEGNIVNGEPQNGSLLIPADLWLDVGRPRSLSNDCLLAHHGSENDDDIDDFSHRSHPRRSGGILARDLILRRAANVRQLLPLELQPFMMPGCFSSVSATTTTYAKSGGTAVVSLQRRSDRSGHRRQRGRRRHLLVAVRGAVKRSSSDPLLPCGTATSLDVSLI
ncbi:Ca 2 calmodulin-responsive adenylate cyclase [Taenia crassiceps]|uniref:adenylate cyclase n=1 Tax=Taenia crassiceps TaxID=6207 RepID=A0ABR4Q8K1_9CEST